MTETEVVVTGVRGLCDCEKVGFICWQTHMNCQGDKQEDSRWAFMEWRMHDSGDKCVFKYILPPTYTYFGSFENFLKHIFTTNQRHSDWYKNILIQRKKMFFLVFQATQNHDLIIYTLFKLKIPKLLGWAALPKPLNWFNFSFNIILFYIFSFYRHFCLVMKRYLIITCDLKWSNGTFIFKIMFSYTKN